jgi:Holliday junction resolvase RusA-like endonuclease
MTETWTDSDVAAYYQRLAGEGVKVPGLGILPSDEGRGRPRHPTASGGHKRGKSLSEAREFVVGAVKTKPRSFTLVLDHLPDQDLSPNARVHWTAKRNAVKRLREETAWECRKREWPVNPLNKAVISYTFEVRAKRKYDLDNMLARCKALQDGLVDGGVITGDDYCHLSIGKVEIVNGKENKTTVTITEA